MKYLPALAVLSLALACKKSASTDDDLLTGSFVSADVMSMGAVRMYTAAGVTTDTTVVGPVARRLNASFPLGGEPFIPYASMAQRPFSATYGFTFNGNTATFHLGSVANAECDVVMQSDDFILLARRDSTFGVNPQPASRCVSLGIASFRDRRDSSCASPGTPCRYRPLFSITIEGGKRYLNLMSVGTRAGTGCSAMWSNTSGRFSVPQTAALTFGDTIVVQEKKLELLRQ